VGPAGRVYLPENGYRGMTEWALRPRRLAALERTLREVRDDARVKDLLPLVRGGNWRSFRVKYEECARMYAKMMEVSAKVEALRRAAGGPDDPACRAAEAALYRGQCNCPY